MAFGNKNFRFADDLDSFRNICNKAFCLHENRKQRKWCKIASQQIPKTKEMSYFSCSIPPFEKLTGQGNLLLLVGEGNNCMEHARSVLGRILGLKLVWGSEFGSPTSQFVLAHFRMNSMPSLRSWRTMAAWQERTAIGWVPWWLLTSQLLWPMTSTRTRTILSGGSIAVSGYSVLFLSNFLCSLILLVLSFATDWKNSSKHKKGNFGSVAHFLKTPRIIQRFEIIALSIPCISVFRLPHLPQAERYVLLCSSQKKTFSPWQVNPCSL